MTKKINLFWLVSISLILSQNINYNSIEYGLSFYLKLMPNITEPFDDKNSFYSSIDNSYSGVISIRHAYRQDKQKNSIKKLKKFTKNIKSGEKENSYVIYHTHHDNNLIMPIVVDLDWYLDHAISYNQRVKLSDKMIRNFTSLKNRSNVPDAALKLINKNVAGTNIALNIRGDITVNGEIIFEDKDLIALNSNDNKTWDIDIEQTQRFDIEGKIGEKLTLNATQDSEADFSWENDLTIKWEGNRNDILQLAEAGNINLSLPSTQFVSVGSGKSEGLFGIKTIHQLGPLEIQSIISREQVKKSAKSFSGGQTSEWSYVNDYNFIKDRYFFIESKFKSQYYPLKIINGNLAHGYSPNGIIYDYKVYKKSQTSNNDVLDIVYGTAYIDPLDESSTSIPGNWKKLIEGQDYEIDRLLGYVRLNTVSSQDAVAICYDYGNYNFETGEFLKDSISSNGTDLSLVYDICKEEDYNGTDEDCDADGDGITNEEGDDYDEFNDNPGFQPQEPKPIAMKLIKMDSPTTSNSETWPLMFKNVYSLGSSISDLSSLELDIVYNNAGLEETHSTVNKFQSFLTIFGLDTRNSNGDEVLDASGDFYLGDGKIDNNIILLKPTYGELFFPTHLPFAYDGQPRTDYPNCDINFDGTPDIRTEDIEECTANGFNIISDEIIFENDYRFSDFEDINRYWGLHSQDLEDYLDTDLDDQDNDFSNADASSGPAMYYSVNQQDIISEHEFMIKYKHASGNSTISLGFMIVEGSETVLLNGNPLSRGIDYQIDYFSGTLTFINPDAMLPGADLNITYEENELISFDQKLLFGTHLKYGFDSQNFISGGLFFYDQSIMDGNVDIGFEPMRNLIWNINGRYQQEVDQLTEFINKVPLIDVTAPSKIILEGEFAEVYPDPNPLGEGFLDDFEASKRSIALNLSARNWKSASYPFDGLDSLKAFGTKKDMVWYNPYNEEATTDIWPTQETSTQAGNAYTKTLWLRPFFEQSEGSGYDMPELWNGITTPLYSSDYDLGQKKYLEIWVNAENFDTEDNIALHIDLGHVSEDINQDNFLNTEDIDVYGNGWGDNNLSDEEDIGLDVCPDLYEDGNGRCKCKYRENTPTDEDNWDNLCDEDDKNIDWESDPNKDNWCYNTEGCSDVDYYRQYNGTEGNADLGRYPDTEDLDKDYSLDLSNNYFTTTIYPTSDEYDEYIQSTNWKLFRVLLNDFESRGDVTVTNWNDIRHVRLWVDGIENEYSYNDDLDDPKVIKIAKLEIVGNEWLELGATTIDALPTITDNEFVEEPYFAVSVLNTHDNPNEYEPPNSEVQGEVDQVSGIRMKEQSLVFSFEQPNNNFGGIESEQALAIKKSFSALPMDKKNSFFAYSNMNMYVYGSQDTINGGSWHNTDSNVELLFRFGKDDQYYEIRQPIYNKWNEKNHIDINIEKLTNYKLEISLEEYEDTGIDQCFNSRENGFGSCLQTQSFGFYCNLLNDSNYNEDSDNYIEGLIDSINVNQCELYTLLSSQDKSNFDPNEDDYSENLTINIIPSEDINFDHPNQNRTENNNQYDLGEPFTDLNTDDMFNPPPSGYDDFHEVWVWDDNIQNVCNYCDELRIKGTPAINNIEFIFVSVLNNTDETIYGSVWLDELRMTGVKKEKGQAFRLKGSIDFSDLLTISSTYQQKDADFHLLQERLGTGNDSRSATVAAKFSSDKFLPTKWGVKIPLNLTYSYDLSSPKFYPGSDILSGGIHVAPDSVQTINHKTSFSTSFSKSSKSDNFFIKYTVDHIKLNFSFIDRKKSTPTVSKEIANDITVSGSYDYNFSDSNFLQPFKFLKFIPILGGQIHESRIYWSPENIVVSAGLSEHNQISTQRLSGSSTPTYSLKLNRKYKMSYRVTKNIKFGYQREIDSNFDDIFIPDGESLNTNIPNVISSFFNEDRDSSMGLIKSRSETFNINFIPDFMKWLNPNIKYNSAYSWALSSSNQNSANIGSSGKLITSVGFSLTDLVENYYKPEKSRKTNRRRGQSNKTDNKIVEINNPILKSLLKWTHAFSEKFSKINITHSYSAINGYGNILAIEQPNLYYRFGLSDSPHNGITVYDTTGSVNSFSHQYTNDFKISTNVSITKKIQASIEYRDNKNLMLQSTSDPTENISSTFFPLGIRGEEGFPIFNWNINWSGLEKFFFLDEIFRTISVQHTFNGDYSASYRDQELQSWGYSRNFSPLFGFTAKTNNKNPYTFRFNYIQTLNITNSGLSTEQKHTQQVNGRVDFNRTGGLRIPIFFFRDFNIQNDINFGLDLVYDRSETLMTSVIIEDPSDFNQQSLSKTISVKPRISYSFTTYVTGDFYYNYIFTENKTTGSTEERDIGFNIRIRIKG